MASILIEDLELGMTVVVQILPTYFEEIDPDPEEEPEEEPQIKLKAIGKGTG